MRGVRFACKLGFELDESTFEAIQRNRARIEIITKERIAEELNKIMLSPKPSVGWVLLDKVGLLSYILPELKALQGIEVKEYVGHKDIFLHTMQVLDNVAKAQDEQGEKKESYLWLRWAALLHDIGKPKTKQWSGKTWTFHNHNYIGMKMVGSIFKKLKLPQNEKMDYVKKMVDLHMRPISLVEDTVTDSAVRRLLFEAGDDVEDLMMLCHADITSKNAQKVEKYHQNFVLVQQKMVELEERDRIRNFQPPVDGQEIMDLLQLPPSPVVGELKTAINAIPDLEGQQVGFMTGKADSEYTITFNYEGDDTWYFNDTKEHESTLISNDAEYTFTTEPGEDSNRFYISATPIMKVTTGVENVQSDDVQSTNVHKVLINDHIYIIRGGRMYDATGKMLK